MKVKNKNCSSIKTKEKIRNAFVESLKEDGSLANISVTKLVKKADISRSTFYTHYESIYDIAKELQDETLELIAIDDSDIKTIDDLDKYIHKVIKNLKENEELYKTILKTREPLLFVEKLSNIIIKRLKKLNVFRNSKNETLEINFFTLGCVNLFVKYFMGKLDCTLDDVEIFIKNMVKRFID